MAGSEASITYGQAIFELAKEKQILEQMEEDLLYVEKLLMEHAELRSFVTSPIVERKQKIKLLGTILQGAIQEVALHFIYIMIQRGRVSSIVDAISYFVAQSREARGIMDAKVRVARPLQPAQKERLIARLEKDTGKHIMLRELIDPAIMGGIIVELGDQVIDASITRRLHEMERVLRSGSVNTTENGVNESV